MPCGRNCVEVYSEQYDAYYCETCNTWLESACDDPTCEYCVKRPLTPKEENDKETKQTS